MLDLEPIKDRLESLTRWEGWLIVDDADAEANKQDEREFVRYAPDDIATLIEEVERLRSDLLAQGEDNASLDRNLKRCVNTLRDVGEIIGVDLNDLSPDLLDRVRAAVQVRSTVADPCRLCGSPMALAEAGSGPDDEDLYRCSRAGCSGEYVRDNAEPRFIVRLEPGVWIAGWKGDPGRTTVKASAKRFPTERSARRALSKARRCREFPLAVVESVP